MTTKQRLLEGETDVLNAFMYTRSCLCIEHGSGTVVYKEDLGVLGHDGRIIVVHPDGSFLFHPYPLYLFPSVGNRFRKYYRARFGSHSDVRFYRDHDALRLLVANPQYGYVVVGNGVLWPHHKVFQVPDDGRVHFDDQGLPRGLKEHRGRIRKEDRYESRW